MEPEIQPSHHEESPATAAEATLTPAAVVPAIGAKKFRRLRWIFIGNQGLRAGWSALAFEILDIVFCFIGVFLFLKLHLISKNYMTDFTASSMFFIKLITFLAVIG